MTTQKPEQMTLIGGDELARHYEGRVLVLLHRITTWAAVPGDTSIDWELEALLQDLAAAASELRNLRGEASLPF